MFTNFGRGATRTMSALSAVAILGLSGLVMERGHHGAVPAGIVELGEFVPVSVGGEPVAQLPELVVTATRMAPEPAMFAGELPRLSELVVVGQREVQLAAATPAADAPRG
ncbi:MAG: hypothetical protein MUC71_10735 [Steroidobacteraceae bacterium]|jgi:hypothetical protein|nr:hypothetical protein [Steroidobacteraceae bacterium]